MLSHWICCSNYLRVKDGNSIWLPGVPSEMMVVVLVQGGHWL